MSEVLKALSFKYGLNILNSSTSDAPITISAKNVPFKTIFNSIIETNNLSWYSSNNIIVVTDTESLGNTKSGLETEVVHLDYIESSVAVNSFKDQLSLRGDIKELDITGGKGSGGTNKLIITDTRERINYIKNLIQSVDNRPTQVNIAVKFIETSLQSDERLGIDWTQRAQLSGPDFAPDSGASAVGIGSWQEFAMAKMDLPLYQVVLEALESDNRTKLLQEPQVTTFDNFTSEINVGTTLPVLVPQGEGSVFGTNPYTFENVSVNIVLKVTPRVNNPNEITMQLDTEVSAIINYVGPDKDRPVVSTRSAKTNVVVGNGETLLIGGLILEDDSDITGKVPFLSNIPLLKRFFTIDTKSEQQRELLIFITNRLIEISGIIISILAVLLLIALASYFYSYNYGKSVVHGSTLFNTITGNWMGVDDPSGHTFMATLLALDPDLAKLLTDLEGNSLISNRVSCYSNFCFISSKFFSSFTYS